MSNRCAPSISVLLAAMLLIPPAFSETFQAKVTEVAKGDVFTVMRDGKSETIRLAGVDSPELAQPFGPEAKQFTAGLINGKDVSVETLGKDDEGRTLAKVTLPDGAVLNHEVIASGMGWLYEKHEGVEAALSGLAAKAIAGKKGLWAGTAPLAPWDFRGDIRKKKAATPEPVPTSDTKNTEASRVTVFVSKDGNEYHLLDCARLGKAKQALSAKDAKKQGFTACLICFPAKSDEGTPVVSKKGNLSSVPREDVSAPDAPKQPYETKQPNEPAQPKLSLGELQDNPMVKGLGVSMYTDPNGQVAGITASNLSSNPLAGVLGLQNNDVVQSVNGEKINSMNQIPQLYEKFKNVRSFQVGILRNGQQQTLTINVPDFIK